MPVPAQQVGTRLYIPVHVAPRGVQVLFIKAKQCSHQGEKPKKGEGLYCFVVKLALCSLVPRPFIQRVYCFQYNTCDTKSNPCWGWLGLGLRLHLVMRSVFCLPCMAVHHEQKIPKKLTWPGC